MRLIIFFIFFNISSILAQEAIVVGAKKPEKKIIADNLELPAKILANEEVKITTVVSEKIEKFFFDEGELVNKNDILVKLFDREEQAIKRQILAELDEADLNLSRAEKLSAKGNISQTLLDNRIMAKKRLSAKLDEIEAKIDDLTIKAPFKGVTSLRNYSEGSLLEPGDVVTTLYDIQKLKIQVKVPDIFVNKINKKSKFKITSNFDKSLNINGQISIVDPSIDDETRTFKILGIINNINNKLKPGQMVTTNFNFNNRESYFIQENSVFSQDDISFVYLIKDENIIKKRVQVGPRKNGMIEILDGLNPSDLIVYEGINKIKEGSKVVVK